MRAWITSALIAWMVFVSTPARAQLSTLHSFESGESPYGTMVSSGSILYGMAGGIAFMYNTTNENSALLHQFTGGPNNGAGQGDLTLVTVGAGPFRRQYLYGVTGQGGPANLGVVFMMNSDGTGYTNLHTFAGATSDGATPFFSSLTQGGSTLYGTTYDGGTANFGTLFKINTN